MTKFRKPYRSYGVKHQQFLANRKVAWKCNLPREQLYWQLRSKLRIFGIEDESSDDYSEEHLDCMAYVIRCCAWEKRVGFSSTN